MNLAIIPHLNATWRLMPFFLDSQPGASGPLSHMTRLSCTCLRYLPPLHMIPVLVLCAIIPLTGVPFRRILTQLDHAAMGSSQRLARSLRGLVPSQQLQRGQVILITYPVHGSLACCIAWFCRPSVRISLMLIPCCPATYVEQHHIPLLPCHQRPRLPNTQSAFRPCRVPILLT